MYKAHTRNPYSDIAINGFSFAVISYSFCPSLKRILSPTNFSRDDAGCLEGRRLYRVLLTIRDWLATVDDWFDRTIQIYSTPISTVAACACNLRVRLPL